MRVFRIVMPMVAVCVFAGCEPDRGASGGPVALAPEASSSSAAVNPRLVAVTAPGADAPFDPKDRPGDVLVRRNFQFEDVPVPHGYTLRKDRIFSFQGSMFRFGDFEYEGHTSAVAVSAFYRDMLPKEGWRFVGSALERGVERLQYRKGDEFLDVIVRNLNEFTRVQVSLYDARHLAARAAYMASAGRVPEPSAGVPAGNEWYGSGAINTPDNIATPDVVFISEPYSSPATDYTASGVPITVERILVPRTQPDGTTVFVPGN